MTIGAALLRTRSGGINDIAVRFACAHALAAAGRTADAQAALIEARCALTKRAMRIADLAIRERYLSLFSQHEEAAEH